MESYPYTSLPATLRYIAMHAKDPAFLIFHVGSGRPDGPKVVPIVSWTWVAWIWHPCSWAGLLPSYHSNWATRWLGASTISMGHRGLPDTRHYCWEPRNHTHK